jgi:hypothetical protein
LITARVLTPAPAGLGTHVQLGIPACAFLSWFGLPCPTCGLTTSFAHMARWELAGAFSAHPLGPFLFAITLALVALSGFGFVRRWSLSQALAHLRAERWALYVALGVLAAWLLRLSARV